MSRMFLRVGRVGLGFTCLTLGVVGLFLPFLQGILLLIVGLTLLSNESNHARRCLEWLRRYLPKKPRSQVGENSHGSA